MKINGLEGIDDPHSIRAEIERGGRFVFYIYCVSIVFMSFKRPSDIYFVRAGRSAVARGLPFTLISLLFGWWGFPWGIVYTLESLVKNLGGGTDVTDAILADLDRANPPATSLATQATPQAMPLRGDAPTSSPRRSSEPRSAIGAGFFRLTLLVAGIGLAVWAGVALYRGAHVRTALVNGLVTPLTFTLDGVEHTVPARGTELVVLGEGDHAFSWTRPDGRVESETFALSTPFWSRPLHRTVAVLNPDRSALVYRETTRYFPQDQPLPEGKNDFELHAGEAFYAFPATDYFFEDFPASISLSNRQVVSKSRYEHASRVDPAQRLLALQDAGRAAEVRTLALRLGQLYPDDEITTYYALSQLKPEDAEAFFALHLDDHPLRLEWHRNYQHHVEYQHPEIDLLPRYRKLAAERPDDGAAAYLVARIETDPAARIAYLRQALAAAHPCAYANNSLAYEALSNGDFETALVRLRDTEKSGLESLSFRSTQREILLANHRHDEVLAHLRALRARDPRPLGPTTLPYLTQELAISCQKTPDDEALERTLTAPYLASLKNAASPESISAAAAQLAATAAYARGDEAAYVRQLADQTDARFAVAITRGDATAAVAALEQLPRAQGSSWLLAYLAACASPNAAVADTCFAKALACFATESREHRDVAARLQNANADPAPICAELLSVDEKCVIATALGHRFPQHRAVYHALAARLNFKPEFPSLFIARQLVADGKPRTTVSL